MCCRSWSCMARVQSRVLPGVLVAFAPIFLCPLSVPRSQNRPSSRLAVKLMCEGCLVVRSGHGPQAEVAQGVGPGPLVEL